jgi:hypothetical protein
MFLAGNFVTSAAMLSATRQAAPRLGGVTRNQAGSATLQRTGTYTGGPTRLYVVEIVTVEGDGNFGVLTTFRWSDDGEVTWQPVVVLSAAGVTHTLSFGVEVTFFAGPGSPQFVVGDAWQFQAVRPFGVEYLIDLSRDTEFRTDSLATSEVAELRIDFGAVQTPTAAILYDHNLLSTTITTLQASNNADYSSPLLTFVHQWRAQVIAAVAPTHWTSVAARYWRWIFTAGSGQGDIRISEAYLGTRTVMNIPIRLGFGEDRAELSSLSREVLARGGGPAVLSPKVFEVSFGQVRDGTGQDREKLEQIWAYTNDLTTRTRRPFWFIPNDFNLLLSQDGSKIHLMHWEGDFQLENRSDAIYSDGGALYQSPIRLVEVVRTL